MITCAEIIYKDGASQGQTQAHKNYNTVVLLK